MALPTTPPYRPTVRGQSNILNRVILPYSVEENIIGSPYIATAMIEKYP